MKYDKTKQKLSELRSKERKAREELSSLENRQSSIDAELNNAYEIYIQKQADQKAGECPEKEVLKAEQDYQKIKSEKDDLHEEIEVSQRVATILKDKIREAESEFIREAVPYHKQKLSAHFKAIQKGLDLINAEINQVNEYRNALQKDHIPESVLNGITYHSKAVITTKNNGSLGMKDLILNIKNN